MSKNNTSFFRYVFSFFDIKGWLSLNFLKKNTADLKGQAEELLFTGEPATGEEGFEDVVKRFKLTQAELLKRQKEFWYLSCFVLCLALAMLGYAFYLLWGFSLQGFVVACSVSSFLCVLAFRYHFWSYQYRRRKLGCTFSEWKRDFFKSLF